MKIQSFKYTDLKNHTTDRLVLVVGEPSTKVSAIDLSELGEFDQIEFALSYKKLYDQFLGQVKALQSAYDLNHRYRQFFEDKMDGVVTEEI